MTQVTGNYELVSSDNFDKYMEAIGKFFQFFFIEFPSVYSHSSRQSINHVNLGVGFLLRKVANSQKTAQVEITKNGDEYTIKTVTSVKTIEVKFKLNEEFKETTLDGRDVNVRLGLCLKLLNLSLHFVIYFSNHRNSPLNVSFDHFFQRFQLF